MEICDRKCMFGDKTTFGSSQNGQNMPKKGQQAKIFFCTLNKGQLPTLNVKTVFYNLHVFKGSRE